MGELLVLSDEAPKVLPLLTGSARSRGEVPVTAIAIVCGYARRLVSVEIARGGCSRCVGFKLAYQFAILAGSLSGRPVQRAP